MTTSEHAGGRDDHVELPAERLPAPREPAKIDLDSPTVGLITAIPEELAAMRALLDDVWEQDVLRDPAHYLRGTLPSREAGRQHDVVLTQLGATATDAAADGCTHLVRSFPSVSLVVMVGTAAGVPNPYRPERHVRLGDIVVATYGIYEYDHVRAVSNGVQPRRQFPSPSPRLVRCADMLKVDELAGERPWERWLDTKPPILAGYGRPPENSDVLHDGTGRRMLHPRRDLSGHRKGFPKLHHGLIGSADRSLWDARTRDQLAMEHDILAFEMEGAGIGNSGFLNGIEWVTGQVSGIRHAGFALWLGCRVELVIPVSGR